MKDLIEEKNKIKINTEFCKGCGVCIHFCPCNAIVFQKEYNSKGFHFIEITDVCSACGICTKVCPDWALTQNRK